MKYISKWIAANWIFSSISFVGFILYSAISISKHLHFNSTGYDLVIFDQAVRHYSYFLAPASSFRGYDNLLGDHFHPILAGLAPLYWIWDSPISLLIAQAAVIASAAVPIYIYTKRKLGNTPALLMSVVFLLNPALLRAVYFDFHEIAIAIPLIAWAIYFLESRSWRWLYVCLALLLLVKEDMSVLVVFFGIYLLVKKEYIRGAIMIGAGIIWFLLATKVFIPYFAGSNGAFNYWNYHQLGPDPLSACLAILKNPIFAGTLLFIPLVKLVTLIKTFGVFLGTTFFSPLIVLAIPLVLERFLSSTQNYWQFNYHYGATLAPILTMAAIDGMYRISRYTILKKFTLARYFTPATLVLAIVAVGLFTISPMNFIFKPSTYSLTDDERTGYATLSKLRPAGSICTTNHIAPHLGKHTLTLIGFDASLPLLTCDYIVVSQKLDSSPSLDATLAHAGAEGYRIISEEGSWKVYGK